MNQTNLMEFEKEDDMFGLELRRKNNITNLFSDVKDVLKKAGIEGGVVPAHFQSASVAHSLQNMLNGNYFDICTVNNCAEMIGLVIPKERLNVYQTQHCVHWSEMLPEYRQALVAMVLDDFSSILNPEKDVTVAVAN